MLALELERVVSVRGIRQVGPHRSLRPRVAAELYLIRRYARGQMHGGGCAVNGKDPTVAGHVPEQFVVVGEKSELAIRNIGDRIGMLAGIEEDVAPAQVNALAVREALDSRGFGSAVAGRADKLETDLVMIAKTIVVARREVAINAVPDAVPGADHADRFRDDHRRVRADFDVAVIIENPLRLRARRYRGQQHARKQESKCPVTHSSSHTCPLWSVAKPPGIRSLCVILPDLRLRPSTCPAICVEMIDTARFHFVVTL